MRANEFINEHKDQHKASMSNMLQWHDVDNNPYAAYRFGVAMAGEPEPLYIPSKESEKAQKLTTFGYTDADHEIAKSAGKRLGLKSKKLSERGSHESEDTYKISPLNSFKGYY